jgi:hypothetical protein
MIWKKNYTGMQKNCWMKKSEGSLAGVADSILI